MRSLTIALVAFMVSVQSYTIPGDETYAITTADVAAEEDIIASETDLGACICDRKFRECDANCCCDPDCADTDVEALFSSACSCAALYSSDPTTNSALYADCQPEGAISSSVITCTDAAAIVRKPFQLINNSLLQLSIQ